MLRDRKGFTLVEVIVVAAIIAILAGILVPMIFNQIDESKKTKATGEIDTLKKAMETVRANTGLWPVLGEDGATGCSENDLLSGPGTKPEYKAAGTALPTTGEAAILTTMGAAKGVGASGCYNATNKYAGPYISESALTTDPWGKAYVIWVEGLMPSKNGVGTAWILSAGPNNIIDTDLTTATAPAVDDIGIKLK